MVVGQSLKPTVSVVIPFYNAQDSFKRCLNSVIQQSYNNIEILLIDDFSNDSCSLEATRLAKNYLNIHYYRHKKNLGVSEARNTGIRFAKGKYVFFIDSDDWINKNAVKEFVETSEKNKADWIVSPYNQYLNSDKINKKQSHLNSFSHPINNKTLVTYIEKYLLIPYKYILFVHCWNKLYRLDLIKKHRLTFDKKLSQLEDVNFNFKYLLYTKKIYYLHKFNYFHFIEFKDKSASGSAGTESDAAEKCYIAFEPIRKFVDNFYDWDEQKKKQYISHHFTTTSIIYLHRMGKKFLKDPSLERLRFMSDWLKNKTFLNSKKFYIRQKNESKFFGFFIVYGARFSITVSLLLKLIFFKKN